MNDTALLSDFDPETTMPEASRPTPETLMLLDGWLRRVLDWNGKTYYGGAGALAHARPWGGGLEEAPYLRGLA